MKTTIITCFVLLILFQHGIAQNSDNKHQPTVPGEKLSDSNMQFNNWDSGKAEIIAISVFSNDYEKYQKKVGTIQSNGSFSIALPNEVKTWQPMSVYKKSCLGDADASIDNPDVKFAWFRLYVKKGGNYIGGIQPASTVEAAYNLNAGGVNNGKLGRYYLWVYADGDATVSIDCKKKKNITDGKGSTYEDFALKDHFNLRYKKGWNIVEVHVIDNIWVGLTKHYTERSWSVLDEIPTDAVWVFRPMD